MAASYYLKLGSLALLTGELKILKMELHEIFSVIYLDKEGIVRISNTSQNEDEQFDVKTHSNQLVDIDTSLNNWIQRHGQVFK